MKSFRGTKSHKKDKAKHGLKLRSFVLRHKRQNKAELKEKSVDALLADFNERLEEALMRFV